MRADLRERVVRRDDLDRIDDRVRVDWLPHGNAARTREERETEDAVIDDDVIEDESPRAAKVARGGVRGCARVFDDDRSLHLDLEVARRTAALGVVRADRVGAVRDRDLETEVGACRSIIPADRVEDRLVARVERIETVRAERIFLEVCRERTPVDRGVRSAGIVRADLEVVPAPPPSPIQRRPSESTRSFGYPMLIRSGTSKGISGIVAASAIDGQPTGRIS